MADGVATAFQKTLIAALRADAGVSALVGARVYDEPPQAAVLPYVRLGTVIAGRVPSDGANAYEITFSVEGHSRPVAGRVEATRLAESDHRCLSAIH